MKKITLKAIKEMLSNTLFIRSFLSVICDNAHSTDYTQRIYVFYRRYTAQITINYDIHTIYVNFDGDLDLFDAKEWAKLQKDLLELKGW